MISDTLSLLVFAVCLATFQSGFTWSVLIVQVVEIAVFVPLILVGLSRLGARLFGKFEDRETADFILMLVMVAVAGVLAQEINLPGIVGAFLAGLAVNAATQDATAKEKLEFVGNSFFIPIFFIVTGFLIDPPAFMSSVLGNFPLVVAMIGALLIGKTNMDQFATGLVGTRSPYGACSSVFDSRYISGGSSSGSALAVAKKLVTFSLGTDTAGSGRVPAAFNGLIGLKPTRGLLSTCGVVPACRSLDCVSIFATRCTDAQDVWQAARGFDRSDPFSREARTGEGAAPWLYSDFRFGVPAPGQLEFFGDAEADQLYRAAL